jgi:DNA polymerase III alpha subunit (gram-positive type)
MNNRLLFLDTETTTGWYGDRSITEVVEFGWVLTEGLDVIAEGQSFASSLIPINAYTEYLIEISNDMIKGAPNLHEFLPEILKQADGVTVVGHNTKYDLGVIAQTVERRGHTLSEWYQEFKLRSTLDTMHLFSKVQPDAPNRKLKTAMEFAGVNPDLKKHRALADAQFTKEVFFWMWPKLQQLYRVDNIDDFVEVFHGRQPKRQLTLI